MAAPALTRAAGLLLLAAALAAAPAAAETPRVWRALADTGRATAPAGGAGQREPARPAPGESPGRPFPLGQAAAIAAVLAAAVALLAAANGALRPERRRVRRAAEGIDLGEGDELERLWRVVRERRSFGRRRLRRR